MGFFELDLNCCKGEGGNGINRDTENNQVEMMINANVDMMAIVVGGDPCAQKGRVLLNTDIGCE